jgi:hypothetical protein
MQGFRASDKSKGPAFCGSNFGQVPWIWMGSPQTIAMQGGLPFAECQCAKVAVNDTEQVLGSW